MLGGVGANLPGTRACIRCEQPSLRGPL